MKVELDVECHDDHLLVRWDDGRSRGSCRFDQLPDATPQYLGSADELLEGTDRRAEGRVLDAVARWAEARGLQVGIWHDDQGVELLNPTNSTN